ncbi:MAG: HAD-IB family phosphatase [Acidobacteriota bacterium]
MKGLLDGEPLDVVVFDWDSTLASIEGIDELGRHRGCEEEIAALTREAMSGGTPLEDVYLKRLERLAVTPDDPEWLQDRYAESLVEGVGETLDTLRKLGKELHVVSGGLLDALAPVALELGFAASNVHAVELAWNDDDSLAGLVDPTLASTGGKTTTCERLLAGRRGAMVGDGLTDLEAAPPCVLAVGFGGVVTREAVKDRAGAWADGPSLTTVLPHLLTAAEADRYQKTHGASS